MRRIGLGIARVLAFVAALLVAGDFTGPGGAHAAAAALGAEMVICSGEATVTITLDRDGNPIEAPGDRDCDCGCAYCPAPNNLLPTSEAAAAVMVPTVAARVALRLKSTILVSERRRLPVPRGPPTEKAP